MKEIFSPNKKDKGKLTRAQTMKTILFGRSHCPNCNHTLHAKDLIPIVSYLSTWGKCRYCSKKIPLSYLLREIWSWILFVFLAIILGNTLWIQTGVFALWILISRGLYLLLVYDIQTMYLHDSIWLLTAILSAFFIAALPWGFLTTVPWDAREYSLIRWGIFLLFFLILYRGARIYVLIKTKQDGEWFWSGDVWVAPILGILFWARQYFLQSKYILFWQWFSRTTSIQHFIYFIILSGVLGLVYYGIQQYRNPKDKSGELPFLPGMITALRVTMFLWFIGVF